VWLADCRPIIGIDGFFLKNNVKGQLLATIGRDANNQFYRVAWCIVPIENADSWIWFIRLLKKDLKLEDGNEFTIISDRRKVSSFYICQLFGHQGKFSLKVTKTIEEEKKHKLYCEVVSCGNGHYEVTEYEKGFRVDMNAKKCVCRRWSMI